MISVRANGLMYAEMATCALVEFICTAKDLLGGACSIYANSDCCQLFQASLYDRCAHGGIADLISHVADDLAVVVGRNLSGHGLGQL